MEDGLLEPTAGAPAAAAEPALPHRPASEPSGRVVVERRADGRLEARARDVTLTVGRSEGALRSVELLLTALGSCMLGTMLAYAETAGLSLDAASVELQPTLVERPERVESIVATLRIEGDLPERRVAALRRAAEHCKVHATLAHGPAVELVLDHVAPA